MQTFFIAGGIKTYQSVEKYIEDWDNAGEVAKYRYRVLCFYDKHGLDATLDAFNISRRTLFRWRAKLKYTKRVVALKPRSSRPITFRASRINPLIIRKIREIREIYPNMGKDKIFHLKEFREYCKERNYSIPSISTIGRIISRDPFKMRYALKKPKIKRLRVIDKRRKPKD
ncbi:helix-turn-helix domain-containing protein [Helicobacter pametensis]|uniref:helix-turn-helix domain-containing protein n=1 Tax=Helicobacter pametensis TaxID=95149 RepID=UPI0004867458|nr:helix-turn-helix domain-containing protein [Helicobacter pametensis]